MQQLVATQKWVLPISIRFPSYSKEQKNKQIIQILQEKKIKTGKPTYYKPRFLFIKVSFFFFFCNFKNI